MPEQEKKISILKPLAALLLGVAILVHGQGLFLLLIPLRLDSAGFSATVVSAVVSAYFAGFIIGAWYCDGLVRSVGHVRAYGGLIATVIAIVLALPFFSDAFAWAILRFLHGAAIAGTFLAIEAWLNAATPNRWRGRVLAVYTVISLAALGGGQLLLNFHDPAGIKPFNLGGILLALSIIPVVLSHISAPGINNEQKGSSLGLLRHSPVGAVASFAAGLNTGAFWALAPLFAVAMGLTAKEVTILMAATIFGGLILEWPIGMASDRFDRRTTTLVVAIVGLATCLAIMAISNFSHSLLFLCIGVYGGVSFSLQPLAISQAADNLPAGEDMLGLSRALLLSNGAGLAVGPLLGGQFHAFFGEFGLFIFAAVTIGAIAAFTAYRMRVRKPVPLEDQGAFVVIQETTPAALRLDPRTDTTTDYISGTESAPSKNTDENDARVC